MIALATASVVATTPVHAQDASANPNSGPSQSAATPAEDLSAIIITGTRRALKTAQQIKRNADTVVDSITATDIGAFPDKSVAEALQRVPGVTVNRFAATQRYRALLGRAVGRHHPRPSAGPVRISTAATHSAPTAPRA